jgi:predicted ATP-dependent endonuclease of OLD family
LKIGSITIKGIKSHSETIFNSENYNIFIGENNTGKSNILFAIRWFFNEIKLSEKDINRQCDVDPSVKIVFLFEEGDEIPEQITSYVEERELELEAIADRNLSEKKDQSPHYKIKNTEISNTKLKNLFDKIDVIYVPSIRKLDEDLKFTANSTINRLVTKYVIETLNTNTEFNELYGNVSQNILKISGLVNDTGFKNLKDSLENYMLDYENIEINFKLNPPEVDDLIKKSFEAYTKNGQSGELPIESQGMGFQRSLIFSLLCNVAELSTSSKKLTLYLIEEPELFLHPNHQKHFRNKLISLSKSDQVFVTSHSPYFVSNIQNYSQIKKISINNGISSLREISHTDLFDICKRDGELTVEACPKYGDLTVQQTLDQINQIANEDELRYLLWIDPQRANAFLSKKVILVEGSTDKALLSFMFDNKLGEFFASNSTSDIMVVDVNGKLHFYKFAHLLNRLGISTWILYDGDDDKETKEISHKKLNKYIEGMKKEGTIVDCLRVNKDIESFLNLKKDSHKPDISLYTHLVKNSNKCRNCKNYKKITTFIENILHEDSNNDDTVTENALVCLPLLETASEQ